MNNQIVSLTERISKLEENQAEQSNQIIDLGKKQENFNTIIDTKISSLNENINKILEKITKDQSNNSCSHKKEEENDSISFDSAEEDFEYQLPVKKRKVNNLKLPKLKKKGKRGPYNKESGPIYYYYSIDNNIFKYTRIKKYDDYEDYRCSFTLCKAKGKYVNSLKKFTPLGEHLEYDKHSYVIALTMKKKILNDEIRRFRHRRKNFKLF